MKIIKQLLGITEKTSQKKAFADFTSAEKKALIRTAEQKEKEMQREQVEE